MKTLKNETGTKLVKITNDASGMIIAMYVQVYNGQEQVLQSKTFSSEKNAERWGIKTLKN